MSALGSPLPSHENDRNNKVPLYLKVVCTVKTIQW